MTPFKTAMRCWCARNASVESSYKVRPVSFSSGTEAKSQPECYEVILGIFNGMNQGAKLRTIVMATLCDDEERVVNMTEEPQSILLMPSRDRQGFRR